MIRAMIIRYFSQDKQGWVDLQVDGGIDATYENFARFHLLGASLFQVATVEVDHDRPPSPTATNEHLFHQNVPIFDPGGPVQPGLTEVTNATDEAYEIVPNP